MIWTILVCSTLSRLIFVKNLFTSCWQIVLLSKSCKTWVRAQNAILVIPYNNVVRIEDMKFDYACGMYTLNKGKNLILGCFKYIIMFVNVQYYFAYLQNADQKIAVSLCCGTLINKIAVSDETSLISSEVECMGLVCGEFLFLCQILPNKPKKWNEPYWIRSNC